jgi:L-fucose isomerase-like protein
MYLDKIRLGLVPLHRYGFDEAWAQELKRRFIEVISNKFGSIIELIYPEDGDTKIGLVADDNDAEKVIEIFKSRGINGLMLVTLTFGDEIAGARIAEEFRDRPIMILATKEPPALEGGYRRSDSFCGTLSLASALHRREIPFLYGGIVFPEDEGFAKSLDLFIRVVAIHRRFVGARIGLVGPRPERFETVAFNEEAMIKKFKQRVIPITLLEVVEEARRLPNDDPNVIKVIDSISSYADISKVPREALLRIAKVEVVLRRIASEKKLSGLGFRCWNEIQRYYGVTPCHVLARLTQSGIMSSCEADVYGALTMLIQYEASLETSPPFFIDWTIRHPSKPNVFLAWHCGNAPPALCLGRCSLLYHFRLHRRVGIENTYGSYEGMLKPGVVTISRLVEYGGEFKLLITRGRALEEEGVFRGSWVWVEVEDLDKMYRTLIEEGFIHHASMIYGDYVEPIANFAKIMGIKAVVI